MAQHQNHQTPNNTLGYEEFTCLLCYKTISADRPPIFNDDNCSCVEAAMVSNGGEGQQSFGRIPRPDSYASSTQSVPSPEGPENEEPDMDLTATFPPVGHECGQSERRDSRPSVSGAYMSYQMRRFLVDLGQECGENIVTPPSFPPRDDHMDVQSSMMACSSSKKSGSKKSMGSSGSGGEMSYIGHGSDAMCGMGTWAEDDDGMCGRAGLEVSGQFE
ncbi:hypothetical protein HYFRA_00002899 [Hymenoscyphus fraxineus]|uniref:Uncharacterized protein n=1 Tax=Hymenoscyphus fraxineus TaxID=746836 RepID=A0A9N9PFP7_9HELO|nr:hypothetical protein HYFRA_00002899 [Hymenoscyphus fraxineus]